MSADALPRGLQNVLDETLRGYGVQKAPAHVKAEQQLAVIERRRCRERECLLRTVLHKLSPYADEAREQYCEKANDEMLQLQKLLTGSSR